MSTLDASSAPGDGVPAPDTAPGPLPPSARLRSRAWLHLVRGLVALAWAAVFALVADPLTTVTGVFLVGYPLIDVVASLCDAVGRRSAAQRRLLRTDALLSALAAAGLVVASTLGMGAVLGVFGVWAVVSGAAQIVTARRGYRPRSGTQWPMLLAGGLSVLAGAFYLVTAIGGDPRLGVLATYAAGGGTFFVLQAALLAWRLHRITAGSNK